MNRLLVDLKEDHKGEIVGRISHSSDSVFVLEAIALLIDQFSESCKVPPMEIVADLLKVVEKANG